MGIYTSSKGIEIETSEMPMPYLKSALNKAIDTMNQENIDVLQSELDKRNASNDMPPNKISDELNNPA